jgi:hypothetical protein
VPGVGEQGNRIGHQSTDYLDDQQQCRQQKRDPQTAHGRVGDVRRAYAAVSVRTAMLVPML